MQSQHKPSESNWSGKCHIVVTCLLTAACWTRPQMKQVDPAGRWGLQVGDSSPHLHPAASAHRSRNPQLRSETCRSHHSKRKICYWCLSGLGWGTCAPRHLRRCHLHMRQKSNHWSILKTSTQRQVSCSALQILSNHCSTSFLRKTNKDSCCRICQIEYMAPELQVTSESAHFVCAVKRSAQHSASKLWVLLADLTKVL